MLTVFFQYFASPLVFSLTFILPVVWYFINRRHVWFSILLTVMAEVIINWGNFCYYESRGLMIIVTLVQIALMAVTILLLKAVGSKIKGSSQFIVGNITENCA